MFLACLMAKCNLKYHAMASEMALWLVLHISNLMAGSDICSGLFRVTLGSHSDCMEGIEIQLEMERPFRHHIQE